MSEKKRKSGIGRRMADFFFPRRCPFCGGAAAGGELMCRKCRATLPFTGGHALQKGTFGRCASPLWYEGGVRKAVLDYKFRGKLGALECFGQLMAQCAAEELGGEFDAVTWVPISKKRLRKRHFDQSRFLAASLCVDWHVPPVETLRKIVDNPPQSGTEDPARRRANVLGVYEAVSPAEIAGKRWLLVDDVVTTGATLTECVRVLKAAGAADVVCLTLAATPRKNG
ncbi:MAG: ComF family protein [Oscillospiraceae bacterium]|nr:ComF family protein [Oscillospiraceae bacterium]